MRGVSGLQAKDACEKYGKDTADPFRLSLIEDRCIGCGTCNEKCPVGAIDLDDYSVDREACVLCFGCLNNCPAQAVYMEHDGTRLIGFREFLKLKDIKIKEPGELWTGEGRAKTSS